jgi:peptide/nickel transport system substrate-binding protein
MRSALAGYPARLLALVVAAALASGCPVGGKRKHRVDRDAALSGERPPECRCPGSLKDGKARSKVLAELASGTPVNGGTLRIHTEVDPPNLNPVIRPDAWISRIVLHDVLETLVVRDPVSNEFEGELAESWESNEDGTSFTFSLRRDVRWHDGKPFTSADVIHTLSMVMAPDSTAVSVKASLEEITGFEAQGRYGVVLTLSKPNAMFLQHLEGLPILPRHLYVKGNLNDHPANRAPVGTGPFRFVSWEEGKSIVIARNDDYWGEKAHLDAVEYVIVKDKSVAFQMLRRGDIDLMPRINADQYMEYEKDADLEKRFFRVTYPVPDFSFLMYNQQNPLFASARVRLAMTYLLDRERIRCAVHRCLARIVSGPWPIGHPANAPEIEPYPFDPAKAMALLAEEGFSDSDGDGVLDRDGKPFKFGFIIPTQSDAIQRMGTIYQEELRRHGIDMQIQLLDWSTYVEKCRSHDFDMAALSFQMEWDNDLTGIFHSKSIDGGQNFISWKNDGVDYILEKARVTLDDDERNALLRDLHVILHQEQPYTFCFSPLETSLISRSFRGLVPTIKWYQERNAWKGV